MNRLRAIFLLLMIPVMVYGQSARTEGDYLIASGRKSKIGSILIAGGILVPALVISKNSNHGKDGDKKSNTPFYWMGGIMMGCGGIFKISAGNSLVKGGKAANAARLSYYISPTGGTIVYNF